MHAVRRLFGVLVLSVVLAAGSHGRQFHQFPAAVAPASLNDPGVTFTKDVAAILHNRCSSCHRPGGGAPFNLLTYDDVRRRATQVAMLTSSRYMPPWKPEPGFGRFIDERGLSDIEIATIQRWVEQGAAEGNPEDMPPAPTWRTEWQLGAPDLVLTMQEEYTLPTEGTDVFRSFVIPIPLARARYVRGLEFRPGAAKAVHHANIKIDRTRSSRRLDDAEAGPGFEGGAGREARFPDGHFLGWTPGQRPHAAENGLWRLDPDSDLVLELHMMPTGKPEAIRVTVGLYLTDVPPSRVPYVIRLGRQNIDIPADAAAHVVDDEYVLPVAVDVLSVQPHAHNLANEMRGWAELPDGSTQPLIYIKSWDFKWQDVYRYAAPLSLPRGTILRMRYTYDNSERNPRNPNHPPRRVTFGQKTSSEMGDLWLQVMPRAEDDRAVLDRDYVPKMLAEDIAGVQKMIELNPRDSRLHTDLAFCYVAAGRIADAVDHLEEAVRLEPDSANAQYDLGTALLQQTRLDEAGERFRQALRLRADFSEAHNNLGAVYFLQGRSDDAIRSYERALSLNANNAEAHYNLGRALTARGDMTEAIGHFARAIEIRPDNAEAYAGLANAHAAAGRLEEAVLEYRRALQLRPDSVPVLVDLAWILASAEAGLRSPDEAVRLAERAVGLTARANATVLDTLALAYFSSDRLESAISTQRDAVVLASVGGSPEAVRRLRQRLEFYTQQRGRSPSPVPREGSRPLETPPTPR